jgi:hypothetical protein
MTGIEANTSRVRSHESGCPDDAGGWVTTCVVVTTDDVVVTSTVVDVCAVVDVCTVVEAVSFTVIGTPSREIAVGSESIPQPTITTSAMDVLKPPAVRAFTV